MKALRKWPSLLKNVKFWKVIANLLSALAISGLMVLGVLSGVMALSMLIFLAISFGLFEFMSKVISSDLEDGKTFFEELEERLNKENEHSE